jgi:hypothetical protein
MNTQEAKRILQGYRPDSADAGDPTFAEALALAASDAGLRAWLDREQEFNRALIAGEKAVPVPAGLRESILTAAHEVAAPGSRPAWRRPAVWWGLAACVALLGAVAVTKWPRPQPAAESALAAFAVADCEHPKTHGGKGEAEATLKSTLKQPTTRLSDKLPVDYTTMRETGCRKVNIEGREVMEFCFRRHGVGLHYYVARREDFPRLKATSSPVVKPVMMDKTPMKLAVWADDTHLYFVVTSLDQALLEKLL